MRNPIIRRGVTVRILIIALLVALAGFVAPTTPAQAEKVLYVFCPNGDCSTGDGPQGPECFPDTRGEISMASPMAAARFNGPGVAPMSSSIRIQNGSNQVPSI